MILNIYVILSRIQWYIMDSPADTTTFTGVQIICKVQIDLANCIKVQINLQTKRPNDVQTVDKLQTICK